MARYGARLPFLLKLLAAEEPLSLQAHPSSEQAREGFARENRLGVPIDSAVRNYRDDSAKPELVVALDRFDALAGFRDPSATVELLEALEVPELRKYVDLLSGQPDSDGLRALFTTWITLPAGALSEVVDTVVAGCARYLHRDRTEFASEAATIVELAQHYPGDPGVLGALLLNRVSLAPGEGLYLNAGNLHAYLGGLAVEIMANSDNVLRGGLRYTAEAQASDTLHDLCVLAVPRLGAPAVALADPLPRPGLAPAVESRAAALIDAARSRRV